MSGLRSRAAARSRLLPRKRAVLPGYILLWLLPATAAANQLGAERGRVFYYLDVSVQVYY